MSPSNWLAGTAFALVFQNRDARGRRRTLTTLRRALRSKLQLALLAVLTLTALLTPPCAMAAERQGSMLFFSFADLKQWLSHPALPTLPSLSELSPSCMGREQCKAAEQEGPLERKARWGNGLGVDGYAYPGSRRPLWGF
jgi:hypothetical protein